MSTEYSIWPHLTFSRMIPCRSEIVRRGIKQIRCKSPCRFQSGRPAKDERTIPTTVRIVKHAVNDGPMRIVKHNALEDTKSLLQRARYSPRARAEAELKSIAAKAARRAGKTFDALEESQSSPKDDPMRDGAASAKRPLVAVTEPGLGPAKGRFYQDRVQSLRNMNGGDLAWCYPRYSSARKRADSAVVMHSPALIHGLFGSDVKAGDELPSKTIRLTGQVKAIRRASKGLHFFDIWQAGLPDPTHLQISLNFQKMQNVTEDIDLFNDALRIVKQGDFISVVGYPFRSKDGVLSLRATDVPALMAPTLHDLPDRTVDSEIVSRRKHVHMRMDRRPQNIIRLRAEIEKHVERTLDESNMVRVRTPILAGSAGGAMAQPFETMAKNLGREKLALRIAPELYLKRLITGGLFGVYEIGPAFRNEGIDNTHNCEFTICEFYRQFTALEVLLDMTERMFTQLARHFDNIRHEFTPEFSSPKRALRGPYKRLAFVDTLEAEIQKRLQSSETYSLPNLESDQASGTLIRLYEKLGLDLPWNPTLPRLLDDLCGQFIEPLCTEPTWILNHPSVLSPLAKSFMKNGQHVAARAELFIDGQEYVNCYEEENDPFEQRRKFMQQKAFKEQTTETADAGDSEVKKDRELAIGEAPGFASGIDESYIEALEWGMPPTGGWGCGIDRLVMFFAGADRIADVLPFGTLKNVVSMSKPWRS